MTETTTTAMMLATDALEQATDNGSRTWFPGREPKLTENEWGGADIRQGEKTYRLTMDDTQVNLYVFNGGRAMVVVERATFTPGLAWLAATYISEALR